MSKVFHFRFSTNDDDQWPGDLIMFYAGKGLCEDDLRTAFEEDIQKNLQPDRVRLIIRIDQLDGVKKLLQDIEIKQAEWRIGIKKIPFAVLGFDKHGEIVSSNLRGNDTPEHDKSGYMENVIQQGMLYIFSKRDGLVKPSESAHFLHPNGRHARAFIRTANTLLDGAEVMFMAFALLQYMSDDLPYIYLDTSSISSLAYALISLRQSMEGGTFEVPHVRSFGSYDGVESAELSLAEKSLALISVTTTGGLAEKLIAKHQFSSDRVVNIFSLMKECDEEGGQVLCKLGRSSNRYDNCDPEDTKTYKEFECTMCKEGSNVISLSGDQFIPEAIRSGPYLIVASDAPKPLGAQMKEYGAKQIFRISSGGDSEPNKLDVDGVALIKQERFQLRLHQAVDRYVPGSIGVVVHLDDIASKEMAIAIIEKHKANTGQNPQLVSAKVLANGEYKKSASTKNEGVLVVAAVVGHGGNLQSVSRDMRDIFQDNPRVFIVGLARHYHYDQYGYCRRDLEHSSKTFRHEVVEIERMCLPWLPPKSVWVREKELLVDEILPKLKNNDKDLVKGMGKKAVSKLKKIFEERKQAINALAGGKYDDLFWNDHAGEPLKIRDTFAFWKFDDDMKDSISQADIFFIVASVLENLRNGKEVKKRELNHTTFYHTFLAPGCFGRFNDGILQASLLRAGKPRELDYTGEKPSSREMGQILERIFSDRDGHRGEACIEFLIALATRRLRLKAQDLEFALKPLIGSNPKEADVPVFLARYCSKYICSS